MKHPLKPFLALFPLLLLTLLPGCYQATVLPPVATTPTPNFAELDRVPVVRVVDGDTVRVCGLDPQR